MGKHSRVPASQQAQVPAPVDFSMDKHPDLSLKFVGWSIKKCSFAANGNSEVLRSSVTLSLILVMF